MNRFFAALILAVLVVTPTATSVCRNGAAAWCCPDSPSVPASTGAQEALARGFDCECCVTVDAFPSDRSTPTARPLVEALVFAVLPDGGATAPRVPRSNEPGTTHGVGDSLLASIRTVVLLV
jgi:hypothetical protein